MSDLSTLQAVWYKKLSETGFRDIENKAGMIDDHPDRVARRATETLSDDLHTVYQHWTHTRQWESYRARLRWVLVTTGGKSVRDMAARPGKWGRFSLFHGRCAQWFAAEKKRALKSHHVAIGWTR